MNNKTTIIKRLKEFKKNLKKDLKISKIIFFGSQANGKPNKDSDIDLLIVSKDFVGKKFRYRTMGFYDYWDLDYPVDFICYTPEEFNKLKKTSDHCKRSCQKGN